MTAEVDCHLNSQCPTTKTAVSASKSRVALSPVTPACERARLMLVDDDSGTLVYVQETLRTAGFHDFYSLDDAKDIVEHVQRENPDVILLDVLMPQSDGLAALRAIRSLEGCEHLPVLIVTSSDDDDVKRSAFALGATDFLTKPLDPVDLCARVRNAAMMWLQSRRLQLQVSLLQQEFSDREAIEREVAKARFEVESAAENRFLRYRRAARLMRNTTMETVTLLGQLREQLSAPKQARAIRAAQTTLDLLRGIVDEIIGQDEKSQEAGSPAVDPPDVSPAPDPDVHNPGGDGLGAQSKASDDSRSTPAQSEEPARVDDAQPPIAWDALLRRCLGKEDFADQLLIRFTNELPQYVEKVEALLASEDRDALAALAHKIKGAAANLCANDLSRHAATLEHAAREASMEEVSKEVHQVSVGAEAVIRHVTQRQRTTQASNEPRY